MTSQANVSLSWVRTVLGEAQRQGIEETTLLRAAGIQPQELERERWPIDHITRLWRAAARLTQDAGFGLKAGTVVGPASFNVVGFIVQSAATLRQALAVVQKYQTLISDGGRFQLLAGAQASWLVYHPRQGDLAFSPHQIEAVLAAVVSASRWITPQPLKPTLVRFSHEAVGPLTGYREAFGCPIEFNQAYSGLLIDNVVLDLPLPQANAQLARLHEQYAAAQLQTLAGIPQPDRVRQGIGDGSAPRRPGMGSRAVERLAAPMTNSTTTSRTAAPVCPVDRRWPVLAARRAAKPSATAEAMAGSCRHASKIGRGRVLTVSRRGMSRSTPQIPPAAADG